MAYEGPHPFPVESGGTGAATFTDHGVLIGSGTGAITAASVGTNGQLLIGSTGADPAYATVTSSDSLLTLTGGAASLDIVAQNAVSASAALTDNLVVRGDGGSRGVQTSTVSISDNGEMTNSSQPSFFAYLNSADSNVTGDGTTYFLGDTDVGTTLTELFDQNADFTPGASGGAIFTAPVDGVYRFECMVGISGLDASMSDLTLRFVTSLTIPNYLLTRLSPANARISSNVMSVGGSALMFLSATDTVQCSVAVGGSTKTAGIRAVASSTQATWFSGILLA